MYKQVNQSEYLNLRELSMLLKLSERSIRNYIKHIDNPLPAYRFDRKLLFKRSEVEAWIASRKIQVTDKDHLERLFQDLTKS